jgi:hypothetical protein
MSLAPFNLIGREALVDINIDLVASLGITTLVVGIVFLARLITGLADRAGPWLMGKS